MAVPWQCEAVVLRIGALCIVGRLAPRDKEPGVVPISDHDHVAVHRSVLNLEYYAPVSQEVAAAGVPPMRDEFFKLCWKIASSTGNFSPSCTDCLSGP